MVLKYLQTRTTRYFVIQSMISSLHSLFHSTSIHILNYTFSSITFVRIEMGHEHTNLSTYVSAFHLVTRNRTEVENKEGINGSCSVLVFDCPRVR